MTPTIIAGDDTFRIVREVTDDGREFHTLEACEGKDAMGVPRWRPMESGKAIQAMKAYIIRQYNEQKERT